MIHYGASVKRKRDDPDVRAFWTRHVALWMRGPLSQREYCELHGISRSLMSKWWICLREDRAREARIAAHLLRSSKIFADDTPVPVLDPGRGRTKTGRLWVYVRDDRPWQRPEPPAALYRFSPDRKGERPAAHLQGFAGVLQVDGYQGFERLTDGGDIKLAACWAHTRRKFYDVFEATGAPIAADALERISKLYEIEATIRGKPAGERVDGHRDVQAQWRRALRLPE